MTNIQRLQKKIPSGIDCILITSYENRRYYTSFPSSAGMLIVTPGNSVFFTDSRYIEAAEKKIRDCEVRELIKRNEQLSEEFLRLNIRSVAVETQKMTVYELNALKKAFPYIEFITDGEADRIITSQRMIKSSEEIKKIRAAQKIAESGFNYILNYIRAGRSERDIQLTLDDYMLRHGAEALSFETIAVGGKNSSCPHGVPSDYELRDGDFLTLDFGAVYDGYHSDMTRTVAIGSVDYEKKHVYGTVYTAQVNAMETIKNGSTAKDADAAARRTILEAGFGEYFRHGTGHGVGIEIHEAPTLSPASDVVLEDGMIVTVEPGIYIPDKFGVRIEDMVVVQGDSYLNLTSADKGLIIL